MRFTDIIDQAKALLQRQGRITYRTLKREFDLDDTALEDLKFELIEGQELAVDKDGKMLVWTGTPSEQRAGSGEQPQAEEPAPPRPTPAALSVEAERRQLTVMFCDLVGSTALSAQLDPEDYRAVVQQYQQTCMQVIERHEGYLAQYLGDGLLVYFGYPSAHEDDAHRAVRTGLEIVEALKGQARQQPLQVRIGIHTGLVVVGEIGAGSRTEQLALGETPNVAARIQSLAAPDTVLISAATGHLVQGYFTCRELGPHPLKGLSQPLLVSQVLHESGLRTRLQVARTTGLTPLVGREQELALLLQRWEQAQAGAGQVVLLSGEAGIGKSRLLLALAERVAGEAHARLDFRCSPYHQHSALYPAIDLLQRALQFRTEDTPQAKLAKLEATFARYGLTEPTTLALFAALLSLPAARAPLRAFSPQQLKHKTLEASVAVLLAVAARQPLLLLAEDLHWADPSTQELFGLLLSQLPAARILAVFAARPEFVPPWPSHAHLTTLTLLRLLPRHVEEMAERVTRGKALPPEVFRQVMSHTDGIPLFVEELIKMVVESDLLTEREGRYELTGPLPPLAIPTTLHDSLMARLDRLSTVKEVAQLGAVLGREFTYELLRAISPLDEATLRRELTRLVEAELLYQTGLPPQATYVFKHALIREAAYQSLLKSTRQRAHQRVAQVLAERFPDTAGAQPELLAHHYMEAGVAGQALAYWQQAGQRAVQRSANAEAISHFTKGLEVLGMMPETSERTRQELTLQVALGTPLMATKGLAAPEVEAAYARARTLCAELGEAPQLFPILVGLHTYYSARGALQAGYELAEQCLRLAQRGQDQALLLEAQTCLGSSLYWLGELPTARDHLEHAVALYDPPHHRPHAFIYGQDPGVLAGSVLSWLLWDLGFPEQALRASRAAVTLAREVAHGHSSALALWFAAVLHGLRREWPAVHALAAEVVALTTEQGFPLWLALGTFYRGLAMVGLGRPHEGLAQMRQGAAAYRATGAGLGQSGNLGELARASHYTGQAGAGLDLLATALAGVAQTGERWYEAELYRLKGELTLQSDVRGPKSEVSGPRSLPPDPQAEAEACFLKALETAQRQKAKSWELRATTSLARLWQHQDKRKEAHQLLSEIYGWFTEGFDTKDLQEAKTLLEELR
jgi:class 3 adenylate cyclase/predicted ATPase